MVLTFLRGGDVRECVEVEIVNDEELENVEEFMMILTTVEERVNLDPDESTVRIVDNDGVCVMNVQ